MKVLYLLRHAKSDYSVPGLPDAARSLSKRGRRAAPLVGAAMRKDGIAPALVLCSTAQRALETWALLAPELPEQNPVKTMHSLYLASPSRILAIIRRLADTVPSAFVLAHNPGLHNLALALAGPGSDPGAKALLKQNYPTGALAEFHFPIDTWADVRQREGTLVRFLRPRDLE